MPSRRLTASLTTGALALALVAVVLGFATRPGQADETDEATVIRRLLETQVDDWNRKDLDGFLKAYWQSPGVVFQSGGKRFDGFEAMRSRYRERYQAEGREMGKLAFTGVEVIPLSNDAALARGRWELAMSDGQKPSGLFTLLIRKRPEGWKIVHDHTSTSP
jgi:ketosteroid isomerase-like protein